MVKRRDSKKMEKEETEKEEGSLALNGEL